MVRLPSSPDVIITFVSRTLSGFLHLLFHHASAIGDIHTALHAQSSIRIFPGRTLPVSGFYFHRPHRISPTNLDVYARRAWIYLFVCLLEDKRC